MCRAELSGEAVHKELADLGALEMARQVRETIVVVLLSPRVVLSFSTKKGHVGVGP